MKKLLLALIVIATAGYFGSKWLLHKRVSDGLDKAVLAISPFATVEYGGVSSTMSGELTIDDIRVQVVGYDDDIRIARLGIDTPSYFTLLRLTDIGSKLGKPAEIVPDYFGVIADGVRLRVNSDLLATLHDARMAALGVADVDDPAAVCAGKYGYSPAALQDLGYDEQSLSMQAHFRRGDGQYRIEVASAIADMWDADAELVLDGDMLAAFARGRGYQPRMASMRIEYRDRSLNARAQAYCERLGLSAEEAIAAQLDALMYLGEENGIVFDEYVIEPYTEFLHGKSTLVVTASPREPVALSQIALYKPSDVPALLDLSAETW